MYNDIKRLNSATAQLPAAAGVLYTAPVGKRAQIGTILLHNANTSTENVRLLDNGSAESNRFLNISLVANETYEFSPKVPIVLEGAETLQGLTTTASKVNIKIYGREES
jgi:hypothetical protein